MQAAAHRRPDILVLGIGYACKCQQLSAGCRIDTEGVQHAIYVNDAGEQTAVLDAGNFGLGHTAAPGQPVTG